MKSISLKRKNHKTGGERKKPNTHTPIQPSTKKCSINSTAKINPACKSMKTQSTIELNDKEADTAYKKICKFLRRIKSKKCERLSLRFVYLLKVLYSEGSKSADIYSELKKIPDLYRVIL